jgi:hypothetical protein
MKKIFVFLILIPILNRLHAQQEHSVFTAAGRGVATTFGTDYHTVGINPANLGFKRLYENKHVTFGLTEIAASAYSGALQKTEFRRSLFNFSGTEFSYEDKLKAAQQFAGEKLALNLDINWFGISYQHDKIGGFALNIRETARWYSTFNDSLADVMFLGFKSSYFDQLRLSDGSIVANDPSQYSAYESIGISEGIRSSNQKTFSQLFEGSKISMMTYREYSLSYGKEFVISDLFAVAGGIGLKYLQGYGIMDIEAKDGKLTAYGAFSPAFQIDFGSATQNNPSADTTGGYKSVGRGFGMDLGFNIYFKEKIKFGVAVTNIGSINWFGNVYTANDTTLFSTKSEEFNNYNIFAEAQKLSSDDGIFKWEGQKSLKTKLPTLLRIGASHQFEDKGEVGFDLVIPVNDQPGTLQKPYWAVGGDFKVFKFLRLSTGFAKGGNYDKRMTVPVGITFVVGEYGTWEVGFASRDAVTYFRQKGPALSLAFGFLRFRV